MESFPFKHNNRSANRMIRIKETELHRKAAYLFNMHGYANTSIRQISRTIKIHGGSLYHYINKKEDLLYNICEGSMLMSLEVIESILKANLAVDVKLQKMIEAHIISIAKNVNEHATMLKELRSLGLSNQRKIIKLRDSYESLFRKGIADCIKEGVFRDVDVRMSTFALLGMANWLVHWYSHDGKMRSEDIARIFSDLFINGLRREPANK